MNDELPWRDIRSRLLDAGVRPEDAVFADKVSAGRHSLSCLAVSRDDRVFAFNMIFSWDRDGNPLPKGQARLGKWRQIPPDSVRRTAAGLPNSWLRAVIIARELFADEGAQPT